jgi:hypothetical protein
MCRVSRRGPCRPRYNFIWDACERIRFEFPLAARLMARLDTLPPPEEERDRLAACKGLVIAIVLKVVERLRPDLLAEVATPGDARYNDDLLPAAVRERVLLMLLDLLRFEAGAIRSCQQDDGQRQTSSTSSCGESAPTSLADPAKGKRKGDR